MKKMKRAFGFAAALLLMMSLGVGCGSGGSGDPGGDGAKVDFPTKEIKVIVPWNAGGGNDVAARELQPIFKDKFGVDLVIENVAGGSSAVGLTQAINAGADGYTLGFMTSTYLGLAAQGTVSDKLSDDFENICLVMEDPIALVCKTGKYDTVEDFVTDASSRPGKAIVAMSNTFGTAPVYCTIMNGLTGMDANLICYDSGSRCVTEVLGGHVEVACSNYTDFADQVAAGEMKVLALMTQERSEVLPDVPTIQECGYDVFSLGYIRQMSFMVAPKGLDPQVKEILADMFQQACQSDEYQTFAAERSFASSGTTGGELDTIVTEVYDGLKDAYDSYFAK